MSVEPFLWWDIHKGYDESDILPKVIEFYELESVTDDLEYDEDKEKLITKEMVDSVRSFLQQYIDEYDGEFGDSEMGQSLSEWCNIMYLNNNDYQ